MVSMRLTGSLGTGGKIMWNTTYTETVGRRGSRATLHVITQQQQDGRPSGMWALCAPDIHAFSPIIWPDESASEADVDCAACLQAKKGA